ncbi:hypothetical protein [Photobacterium lutimaris]
MFYIYCSNPPPSPIATGQLTHSAGFILLSSGVSSGNRLWLDALSLEQQN